MSDTIWTKKSLRKNLKKSEHFEFEIIYKHFQKIRDFWFESHNFLKYLRCSACGALEKINKHTNAVLKNFEDISFKNHDSRPKRY